MMLKVFQNVDWTSLHVEFTPMCATAVEPKVKAEIDQPLKLPKKQALQINKINKLFSPTIVVTALSCAVTVAVLAVL